MKGSFIFNLSFRYSIYSAVAFLTYLAIITPVTRFGVAALIIGYLLSMIGDTFINYGHFLQDENVMDKQRALLLAIADNSLEFLYFFLALAFAVILGCF